MSSADPLGPLAEALDCSIDDVLNPLDAGSAYRTTSTDTTDGSIAAEYALARTAEPVEAEDHLMFQQLPSDLSERDRRIVGLRYLEDLNQSEIAERVGVNQVHVSRLIRASLAQMRGAASEAS